MNVVAKTDDKILTNIFEPLAWQVQLRYEVTAGRLARICRSLSFLAPAVYLAYVRYIEIAILMVVFGAIIDIAGGRNLERQQNAYALLNPKRLQWPIRFTYTCLVIAVIGFQLQDSTTWLAIPWMLLMFVFLLSSLYFSACNPMPPKFRKEQEAKEVERHMHRSAY